MNLFLNSYPWIRIRAASIIKTRNIDNFHKRGVLTVNFWTPLQEESSLVLIGVRAGGAGGAAAPPVFWKLSYSGKNGIAIRAKMMFE